MCDIEQRHGEEDVVRKNHGDEKKVGVLEGIKRSKVSEVLKGSAASWIDQRKRKTKRTGKGVETSGRRFKNEIFMFEPSPII